MPLSGPRIFDSFAFWKARPLGCYLDHKHAKFADSSVRYARFLNMECANTAVRGAWRHQWRLHVVIYNTCAHLLSRKCVFAEARASFIYQRPTTYRKLRLSCPHEFINCKQYVTFGSFLDVGFRKHRCARRILVHTRAMSRNLRCTLAPRRVRPDGLPGIWKI